MAVLMAEGCWWTAANKKAHSLRDAAREPGYACDEGALNHVMRLLEISLRNGCFVLNSDSRNR